jgi:HEAT repeat protein
MLALAKLGPPALPTLAAQLSSPNGAGDLWLMACIRELGTNACSLVPLLVKNLNRTNWFDAMINAEMLGELKRAPDLAVPALTTCLNDSRREVRMVAPRALMQFGELARESLPALTNALTDPDPDVRGNAARAIPRILGEGRPLKPTQ